MRLACLTCTLFCLFFSLSAQPPDFELIRKDLEKVDSLIFTLNQEKAYPIIKNLRKQRLSHEAGLLLDVYEARTHFHNRELEKGLKMLRTLKEPVERKGDAYLKGNWLLAKGIYHFRERENDSVVVTLNRAEIVLRQSYTEKKVPLFFAVHYKVLTYWWRLAKSREGLREAEKLMDLVRSHSPKSIFYADASYSLGTLYQDKYDLESAKSCFLESLSIAQNNQWGQLVNDCLVALGNLYYNAERFGDATDFYEKAIDQEIERNGVNSRSLINYYNNCASGYKKAGVPDLAYQVLQRGKSLAARVAGQKSLESSWFSLNLANFFLDQKNYDSARYYFNENLSLKTSLVGLKHDDVGWAYGGLAEFHHKMKNNDSALYFIQKAIVAAHPTFENFGVSENPPFDTVLYSNSLFTFMYRKGVYLHKKSLESTSGVLNDDVFFYYNELENLLLSRREIYSGDMTKMYMFSDMKKVFELGLDICYARMAIASDRKRMLERSFKILQMSKSVQLLEEILLGTRREGNGVEPGLLDSLKKYETLWATFEDLSTEKTINKPMIVRRQFVRSKLDSISTVLSSNYPQFSNIDLQNNLGSLDQLSSFLSSSSSYYAEFFWGANSIYCMSYDGDDFVVKKVADVNQVGSELATVLGILTANKQQPELFSASAFKLSSMLFNNAFLDHLEFAQVLYLVPDGPLAFLPFEVLLTAEPGSSDGFNTFKYLLFAAPIAYSFSSQLMIASGHERVSAEEVVGLGYYNLSKTRTNNLPGSKKELDLIRRYWEGEFVYDASRDDLLKNLNTNKILHVAVHGGTDTLSIFGSYLSFANKEGRELKVYSNQLHNEKTNSPLVVLSACQSGFGKSVKGEGILSLGRAFRLSGARAVIQSLWRTDDDASVEIMGAFYRAMRTGEPPLMALYEARKKLVSKSDYKTAHPARWASFVYYGNLEERDSHPLFIMMALALAGLLFFLYIIRKR